MQAVHTAANAFNLVIEGANDGGYKFDLNKSGLTVDAITLDNIEQGDDTLFDENETEIIVTFTDDGSRDDFYLFDFDLNL